MAKPLFVIITRMHAIKGQPGVGGDEYTSVWQRGTDEEYVPFGLRTCDALLVHGYRERYAAGREDARKKAVADQLQEAITSSNLKPEEYEQRYLLYHAPEQFWLSPSDVASAFGGREVIVAKYSSLNPNAEGTRLGPRVEGALKQLGFSDDLIRELLSRRSPPPDDLSKLAPSVIPSASRTAFSHLKHQISHLFLPLSIDLQGMESVEGAERLAYAEEILKERRDKKYCFKQRFSNLRYLVAKVDDGNGKTLSEDALPSTASVWNWLVNFELEGREASKNLLVLSGLVLRGGRPEADQDSQVWHYFSSLDQVGDAKGLMPAMAKLFQISLWDNGQPKEEKLGFETWLNKLDGVLDELRGMLFKLGEERPEVVQSAS